MTLLAGVVMACTSPTASDQDNAASADFVKRSAIPVDVGVIIDANPSHAIRGDGVEYVHGIDGITAVLDATGNFSLVTSAARPIRLDLQSQLSGAPYLPTPGTVRGATLRTLRNSASPAPPLQSLPVGTGACYPMSIEFTDGITEYRVHGSSASESAMAPATTWVEIFRSNPFAWTLTPANCPPAIDNVAALFTQANGARSPLLFRGTYLIPFAISIRQLGVTSGGTGRRCDAAWTACGKTVTAAIPGNDP